MCRVHYRRFIYVIAAFTASLSVSSANEGNVEVARVFQHKPNDGQPVQAVLVQRPDQAGGQVYHDHLVLIDTSASQIGAHRDLSLAILQSLLLALPETDRVCLFAVDVDAESLMPEFAGPGSEAAKSALEQLQTRIPLGATNLQRVVESALATKPVDRPCDIVYLGDGMSSADLLETSELARLVAELKHDHVPFHSFGVGPQINLQILGILAHQTGGFVDFDHRISVGESTETHAKITTERGSQLARALKQPVLYPTSVELKSGETSALPLLPLRSDRDTIQIVRGALAADARLTIRVGDDVPGVEWNLAAPVEQPNLAFLAVMSEQFERDHGLTNCLAGRPLMYLCQHWFTLSVKDRLQVANRELEQGHLDQASVLAHQVAELDPENAAASNVIREAEKLRVKPVSQPVAADGEVDPPPPQPGLDDHTRPNPDPSLIREREQEIRVVTEKMRFRVNTAIADAQVTDPESGLARLKQARVAVLSAEEIAPEDRHQLLKRLDGEIAQVRIIKDKLDQERVHLAERLSQLEARSHLTEEFELEERKLEGLIDRVRALMLEGKHGRDEAYGEAQNVADVAINLRPGEGTSAAARFDSEAAQQLNRAYRLRARRADQLLETLHQVELAHIPFPDEPPVRYPAADVWRALSERRKQWADVDLHRDSVREKRIRQELKQTTEANFVDIPLKDALEYLEQLHHIEIWTDNTALSEEGISTDATVNLTLSGVTLRSVLRLMLEPMLLTYNIEDEVLKITTQAAADEKLSTRVYPVADLAVPITSPMMGGMRGGMGGMGGGMMGGGMGGMGGGMMGGGMGGMGGGMGGGFFSIPPEPIHLLEMPVIDSSGVVPSRTYSTTHRRTTG